MGVVLCDVLIRVVNPWCGGVACERPYAWLSRCGCWWCVDWCGGDGVVCLVRAFLTMSAKNGQADISSPCPSHRSIAKQVSDTTIQKFYPSVPARSFGWDLADLSLGRPSPPRSD